MTTETAAKKDTQKLQRAIVDGLEDVKGQDIQVFNTEHLSPLFERVIVASGTSNRQTRALASSVVDAVREAGFPKPRIEGEDNGEWIIVDCGAAVAHIMQPAIRQYYHLEEIWGDKPIRLRLGAAKPAQPEARPEPAVSKKTLQQPSLRRSSAVKTAERDASAAKKTAAKKTFAKTTARSAAGKAALKSSGRQAPAGKSAPAKSAPAKSTPARSTPARSAAPRSSPAKKTAAKSASGKPRSR
ncbi:ribosome silencing factor [Ramlibacter sp. PS3R-8]|uniref:ribosome silencing factor n=1 Tax=Ramlibacter sp. PS3R-8 TaxID=3133437 RepID=UPI0030A4333E